MVINIIKHYNNVIISGKATSSIDNISEKYLRLPLYARMSKV